MASSLANNILSINKAPYLYHPIGRYISDSYSYKYAIFQESVHWMIAKFCQSTLDLKLSIYLDDAILLSKVTFKAAYSVTMNIFRKILFPF